MTIQQLEKDYGDFYVPTHVTKVGGKDLVRDLFLTVSSVSVDLKERVSGRFSFTVANAFDWKAREFVAGQGSDRVELLDLFAFGSPVEISLGYGDPTDVVKQQTLTGLITTLSTNFAAGGTPELTISGYDDLYRLTVGKHTRHWEPGRDSEAVSDVVGDHKISTKIPQVGPEKPRIDQHEQTDLSFVEKLAKRNGATYYMRAGKFYFGPRQNKKSKALELLWGKGLVSFSPEANLAHQTSEVKVHGWSAAKGEPILGHARRGDETGRDTRAESGGDRVATALGKAPVVSVRAALHTQAEGDARARGLLEERAHEFVSGRGESVGIPDIVPDVNIFLGGMGAGFSKTYLITEASHTINSSGYRTSFNVRETTV